LRKYPVLLFIRMIIARLSFESAYVPTKLIPIYQICIPLNRSDCGFEVKNDDCT
jgi:hypothetical protein